MTRQLFDPVLAREDIREKIVGLARGRVAVRKVSDDELIHETGLLDSAAIMELVMWLETRFDISIDQADLTIENLGSVNAMVDYLERQ